MRYLILIQLLWFFFHLTVISAQKNAPEDKVLSDPVSIEACEGELLNITCPSGKFLFLSGVYVVLNSEKCPAKSSKLGCTNQVYEEKSQKFSVFCKNKEKCIVKVNQTLFGKECNGDIRHMSVTYLCSKYKIDENNQIMEPIEENYEDEVIEEVEEEVNEKMNNAKEMHRRSMIKSGCENDELALTCADKEYLVMKKVLVVINGAECPHFGSKLICSNETYAEKSFKFATKCKKQQNCLLKINSDLFGKECNGDIRFLNVTYECRKIKENKIKSRNDNQGSKIVPEKFRIKESFGDITDDKRGKSNHGYLKGLFMDPIRFAKTLAKSINLNFLFKFVNKE